MSVYLHQIMWALNLKTCPQEVLVVQLWAGRFDGYFQNNLHIWDIAAGIIIVKEAGGILNDINLSEVENLKIRASSNIIYEKMLKKLSNF